jgi:hypothetical protein
MHFGRIYRARGTIIANKAIAWNGRFALRCAMLEWNEPLAKRSAKVKGAACAWATRICGRLAASSNSHPRAAPCPLSVTLTALCVHISAPARFPIEIRSATVKQTNQQLWLKFQALFNAIPVLNNENAHRCFCQKRLLIPGDDDDGVQFRAAITAKNTSAVTVLQGGN